MHKNGGKKESCLGLVILRFLTALVCWFVTWHFLILLGLLLRYDVVLPLAFLVSVEASFIGSNKKNSSLLFQKELPEYTKPESLFSCSHAQCSVIQKKVLSVAS